MAMNNREYPETFDLQNMDHGMVQGEAVFGAYDDPESAEPKGFSFDNQSVRRGFIRKVYMILLAQLGVSFGVVALFVFNQPIKQFAYQHAWLFWLAFAITLMTLLCMACYEDARRQTPTNFIFLSVFTLAESFLLGMTSSLYAADEVLLAIAISAAVCFALTIFAMQTKYDFTMCGGMLLAGLIILLIFGFVTIFVHGKIMTLIYSACGALLFSVYLIYDTQLMLGGKHKYAISPEEYIFAALNLYLDVINIFIYILSFLADSDN